MSFFEFLKAASP